MTDGSRRSGSEAPSASGLAHLPAKIDLSASVSVAMANRAAARSAAYAAFSSYDVSPFGSSQGACGHCLTEPKFDELRTTVVAELTREQLELYCASVWPGVSDFKHFLPRLLELAEPVGATTDWYELERKLPEAGFSVCSAEELAAVAAYVVACEEYRRASSARDVADPAVLLAPLLVPKRIAFGLPLAAQVSTAATDERRRLFSHHLEVWESEGALAGLALLARGINAFLDQGDIGQRLRKRKLVVTPQDDFFFHWATSGSAQAALTQALDLSLPDSTAAQLGTALARVAEW